MSTLTRTPARPPVRQPSNAIATVRTLAWIFCLMWIALALGIMVLMFTRADSALREINALTFGCFAIILPYVVARAVDSLTRVRE